MAKNLQHDPNKKHYFTQLSVAETTTLINEICSQKLIIQVWPEGGSEKNIEEYTFQKFDEEKKLVFLKSKGLLKLITTSKLAGKKIFAKFQIDEDSYFTHAKLNFSPETSLYNIPSEITIYKTVQRKDYRLDAGPHTKIKLKVSENVVLDCNDISAGGTSFTTTKDKKPHYPKGKIFENCILRLNTEIFEIPKVKIMSHIEKDGKEEVKIGMAFLDLDEDSDIKLCKMINVEAKGVEIRKIMLNNEKKSQS